MIGRHTNTLSRSVVAICAAIVLTAFTPTQAQATEKHVFDPVLSLTGNCATSALDEVPDPGLCPMPPGVPGVDHPLKKFDQPCGSAVDRHGDIYVASAASGNGEGTEGRIDVFNAQGEYLTEIKDENQPCKLAVDSEGNLYAAEHHDFDLVLFEPKSFPPTKGSEYEGPTIVKERVKRGPTVTPEEECRSITIEVAVDPSDDHLYSTEGCKDTIFEYNSAANGNALLAEHDSEGAAASLVDIAVYGKNHDIYASGHIASTSGGGAPEQARAYIFDGADGHLKCEIDGSQTPQGGFSFAFGEAGVAVDQSDGDLYLADVRTNHVIDQFDSECNYVGQLEHSLTNTAPGFIGAGLAFDAPYPGQSGYDSPNEGELYVAQGLLAPNYHLYAFKALLPPKSPEVRSQRATAPTSTEAVLKAEVNPNGVETSYRFQYTTQAAYEADRSEGTGYEHASSVPVPDASAGAGATFKTVSVPVEGLSPDTAYRFRLVASNHCSEAEPQALCTTLGEGKPGEEGEDAAFSTYGPEAGLPDNRAYELVSPPDTNGLIPTVGTVQGNADGGFATALVSPDGQSVSFGIEGGSLPGLEGNGYNDIYRAVRGPDGWRTSFAGLTAAQSSEPFHAGISPDHLYSFWQLTKPTLGGTLAKGNYLLGPEGVEPIGIGSLGEDLEAGGRWIGEGGESIVFLSGSRLEPEAGSEGPFVYRRSADGPTEVLSLLPGDVPPATGAKYLGTSKDGTATAFGLVGSSNVYVRLGGETQLVAEGSTVFGGISAAGERIAYLRPDPAEPRRPNPEELQKVAPGPPQGEIFSYDTETEETKQVGSGDESVLVNVSPDGSHVYFDSPKQLDGEKGEAGAENLYVWDAAGEAVRFIATLGERDVYGEENPIVTSSLTDGLALWADYAVRDPRSASSGPGADPSRTSADGSALIFESRAKLTGYDNDGHAEIYRYDANAEALSCISCNPTGLSPDSDASLQSLPPELLRSLPPVNLMDELVNLSRDGARVLFQSDEPLVLGDVDGKQDVYEWEAPGKGTCTEESPAYEQASGGCISLISGGHSASEDWLYGMSADGSNVVFLSGDLLSPEDKDKTASLYDARVDGGFPPPSPPPAECLGEACQPAVVVPGEPDSRVEGSGSPGKPPRARCPKGKRQVRKAGKARCVARHKKQRQRKRADANRGAHR
jgi:hypothetical protein